MPPTHFQLGEAIRGKSAGAGTVVKSLLQRVVKVKPVAAGVLREGGDLARRSKDLAADAARRLGAGLSQAKDTTADAARRLGSGLSQAKDRVADTVKPVVAKGREVIPSVAKQVAGVAPGEKLAPSPLAAVRNLGRALAAPQIPGLDRAVSAGPVVGPQLKSPLSWPRALSSSRPAQPDRAYDGLRQGLAHAVRGSGRAAVGLSAAGIADGVFRSFPNRMSDEMQDVLGSNDPGHRAKMRAAMPGWLATKSLIGLGGDSPVDKAHADVVGSIAVPWARDAVARSETNPFARAAKALRWLNPAGAAFNVFGAPRIGKPLQDGELGQLVGDAVKPHAAALLNPVNLRANLASPWTKMYLDNLPQGQTPRTLASALAPLLATQRQAPAGKPSLTEAVGDIQNAYRGTMPKIQTEKPLSDSLKAPPLPTWLDEGAKQRLEEAARKAAPYVEKTEAGVAGAVAASRAAELIRIAREAQANIQALTANPLALWKPPATPTAQPVAKEVAPTPPAPVEFEPVVRSQPEVEQPAAPKPTNFGDFQTRRNLLAKSLVAKGMTPDAAIRQANEMLRNERPG